MARKSRKPTTVDRQLDADFAYQLAAEVTPAAYRDLMRSMLRSLWPIARGDAYPHALPAIELEELRMHLGAALDLIECAEIEARPAVLERYRAAAEAAADKPLQALLSDLERRACS